MNDEFDHLNTDDDALDADIDTELGDADMVALASLLSEPSVWEQPPASLEDDVVSAIATAAAPAATATKTSNPAPNPAAGRAISATTSASARRRHRAWTAVAIAMVAAAASLMVAVIVLQRNAAADITFSLAPTELAPGASGRVQAIKTSSGWRIDLAAKGLPRLDGGRFYQGWLRRADGSMVPIGTFNEGKGVVLWAGVSPEEYRTLTVTIEESDGDQASSGRRVLAGTYGG